MSQEEGFNLLQIPEKEECIQGQGTSPLKHCPKSPVKRMKKLEEKENLENQENIETTYKNQTNEPEQPAEEEEDTGMSETVGMEPKFAQEIKLCCDQPKSILGLEGKYLEASNLTETQEANRPVNINNIIEVDSYVINYG